MPRPGARAAASAGGSTMDGVIDADSHVVEHEAIWDDFDDGGALYPYRPLLVTLPICIHNGAARFPAGGVGAGGGGGAAGAFTTLVTGKLPERFPELRFGL